MSAMLILLALLLIFLRLYVFKSRSQRILEKFPGPRTYPVIGSLLEFNYPKVEITETFKQLSYKYGPVFLMRVGLEPVICLRSPEDVEIILGSVTVIDKAPSIYWPLYQWLNQGLLTSTGEKWKKHRKLLTPAFHFKILEKYIPVFVKNSHILVEKLSNMLQKEFDIMDHVSCCILDNIVETAMGVEINAQQKESEYLQAVKEVQEIMAHRNFNLLLRTPLFHLMPCGQRYDERIAYLHKMTENVMKERKSILQKNNSSKYKIAQGTEYDIGIKEKKNFLDILLEYNNESAGMTDAEIRDEVDTFMFAGFDTSTSAISFCLYCLSQNPDVQDNAYEEIIQIFGDSDRDCTYQDLQEMKYLEKVIKETMRHYPIAQFIARITKTDLELTNGYTVPENTSIMILIEAMNHDPEVYPDPLKFDPERFDNKISNPYAFIPFSAGQRNCIGQRYAMLAIKCVVSLVLRKFKLLPSDIPITPWFHIVMKSSTGVHLGLEPRTVI